MAEKLTFKDNMGYGSASLADAIAYSFVGTFLLFFLTNVAHIPPAAAGTITAIGAVSNAICNPIIGYISDMVRTRFGKRRPVMLAFSFPLALVMWALFTDIELPLFIKICYYGLMTILFWICFTGFFIPYSALGTEYTSDYQARTVLRLYASFFNSIGTMLVTGLPTIFIAFLERNSFATDTAWSIIGGLFGAVAMLSIIATAIASKNKDLPCAREKREKNKRSGFSFITMLKEYLSVIKLKPMKYLICMSFFSLISQAIVMSVVVYYLTYCREMSSGGISAVFVARMVLSMIMIPIVNRLIKRIDKRATVILFYVMGCAGLVFLRLTGIGGIANTIIYVFSVCCVIAIYWQVVPSIFYDVCEYDTCTTGQKREGVILSVQGFVEALAQGIGDQILGIILQIAGFSGAAAIQTAGALAGIENSALIFPIIFFIPAIIALFKYPITKKSYEEMHSSATPGSED